MRGLSATARKGTLRDDMFTNSTTVAESTHLAALASLAGLAPLPTATAAEIADAVDADARAERDAGDPVRAKYLFAVRDCIDAVAAETQR
jgi:hypothetical protein